ncbi:primary-amine oxidase [Nakamurella endophytica]|uniref:Amine oxidase n=1 Tax=Nakamurella endophytica TaxID=1748367 RepID=A0A917SUV9_9ACTN|nr:primary-amine oxidase [Nakamurella endophytica]GGL97551.1 amine oxidase [Nakamurella endophytica]
MSTTATTDVDVALRTMSADEVDRVCEILRASGDLGENSVVSYLGLAEPDRRTIATDPGPRRFRGFLLDLSSGESRDVLVCPADDEVLSSRVLDPMTDGAVPVVLREFSLVEEVVHANPDWRAAMARRGLTDLSTLRVNPLSAGVLADGESGRRIQRCFTFVQRTPDDLGWAHPVDGVTVMVDVISGTVLEVVDYAELPVPAEDGNFHLASWRGPDRDDLRPIEITQPDGPSFTIDELGVLRWAGWRLQVTFDQREGLVLRNIAIQDGQTLRPVLARASLAEMVVPYGDPSPQRWFQNFFDGGEYLLGGFANSLELGCDCLGEITYLDAVVCDNAGRSRTVPQAICIHEEDTGILWKHTDHWNGSSESRRNRRLVVSFFVTVGNYDYGFYWYFGLDGAIELEVKATGVVFTSAFPGTGYQFATEVAPGLGAPIHQHLFCARLDVTVDGPVNAVDEIDAVPWPIGPDNPRGNAFGQTVTRLRREGDAQRTADNTRSRIWRISNPGRQNRLGQDVGWALHPEGLPVLLADPRSDIARRAAFATRNLWVTAYDPAQNYPAGDFVNLHPGGAGLPAWTADDRPVDGTDITLWHTFGLTHYPRIEDWPVMPVDRTGFVLRPHGFFDRNPALNVPPTTGSGCHPGHHQAGHPHDDHHGGDQ